MDPKLDAHSSHRLEEVQTPSFLARLNLREMELDSRKRDCKAGIGDRD